MILGWSPFKIVSVSAVLYPRWPPLLNKETSSNGQNCSILSQKMPKFDLYKHNDELCVRRRRPSYVVIFLKNLLLWNYLTNWNQTWSESSLWGLVWKCVRWCRAPTNMGAVTKNRTYGKIARLWVITQKPLIISKIWHGIKMISTARSTYLAILK